MQMRFVAKTTINLGLILTSALFTSEQKQPAQGPPPSAAIAPAIQSGPVWPCAKYRHVCFSEENVSNSINRKKKLEQRRQKRDHGHQTDQPEGYLGFLGS